jgi:hypothetical protein
MLVRITDVIVVRLGLRFLVRLGSPREIVRQPSAYRLKLAMVATVVGWPRACLPTAEASFWSAVNDRPSPADQGRLRRVYAGPA